MRLLSIAALLGAMVSLSSGMSSSPLTSLASFWSRTLEPKVDHHETFMGGKDYDSEISMSINPGCTSTKCSLDNGASISLINLTVVDEPVQSVEYRWLWSVIGHPTVQAAITQPGDKIKINWQSIFGFGSLANAISYEQKPDYSGSIMLLNLIEFNDVNNTGHLSTAKEQITYNLDKFFWERKILENTTSRIRVEFIGINYTSNSTPNLTGKINITISGYSEDGFGIWLPHLCHSQRTNQMDIQLERLHTESGFNQSRFALEFVVVSDVEIFNKNGNVTWQNTTTLDDEHTPGIFKTEELVIPGKNGSLQSYLQWRPVVYTTYSRDLSESTGVNVGSLVDLPTPAESLKTTLLYALYGEDLDFMLVKTFNVTLGSRDDGFYKKTKYQAWTFTYGVGNPIHNGFSPIVILVMTVMVGFLLLVFMTAGIICIVKKWKTRSELTPSTSYTRLQS